MLFLYVVLS